GPMRVIEVFPYNGDAAVPSGPNRNPASAYHGKLDLTALIVPKYPNNTDVPGTMYYSADAPNTISQDWNAHVDGGYPTTWCTTADGVTWTVVHGAGSCPTTLADVTAFMFLQGNALGVVSSPNTSRVNIPFTLQAGDTVDPFGADANRPGDNYTNRFTGQVPQILKDGQPQRLDSNTVRVKVVGYSVGDWLWFDRDDDGIYDAAVDFVVPDGTVVELYSVGPDGVVGGGDDVLLGSTSTTGGQYLFTDLPDGMVYVQVPASEFQAGGHLYGFRISNAAAGVEDENDDVSHDAVAGTGGLAVGGAISTVHTLQAPVLVNGQPVGSEPSGDNLHGIVDPTTTDRFSNLTVDLAFNGLGSIGDRVWYDVNRDGVQDAGEPGIQNATVTVTWFGPDGVLGGGDDIVFPAQTTDGNGIYGVSNLPYGKYQVAVAALDPDFGPTFDLDGIGTPHVAVAELTPAVPNRTDVDFGYSVAFTLGNKVWFDSNNDGNFDVGERNDRAAVERDHQHVGHLHHHNRWQLSVRELARRRLLRGHPGSRVHRSAHGRGGVDQRRRQPQQRCGRDHRPQRGGGQRFVRGSGGHRPDHAVGDALVHRQRADPRQRADQRLHQQHS
ncbi:MAG TPA: SdrD B-like domain-containing protein, partial [Ilumatobacteraceae bacterium]|nr:SdrD B-like domain-containing protein [Ilumatobacteraceae bacterium]